MLVATMMVSATNIKVKGNIEVTSSVADVPVWEIGDSWTYNQHYNVFAYNTDGIRNYIYYHNCTSTYTVTDDTGDAYTVEMASKNDEGSLVFGSFRLKFTPFTKLYQELEYRKTDLAYVRILTQEKGPTIWLIGEIGIPIPAQYSDVNEDFFTPSQELIPFPLTAGKTGTFPSFTVAGHEKMSLYFGLIKLIDSDFSIEVPAREYICEMATITVPAGTYEAYNLSTDVYFGNAHNFSYSYYVPEIGFFAKLSYHIDWDDSGKTASNYELELISTTYKPCEL